MVSGGWIFCRAGRTGKRSRNSGNAGVQDCKCHNAGRSVGVQEMSANREEALAGWLRPKEKLRLANMGMAAVAERC